MRIKQFIEIFFDDDADILDRVGPVEGKIMIDLDQIEFINEFWRSKKDIDPEPKICRIFLKSGQSANLIIKYQTMVEYWMGTRVEGVYEIRT